VARPGFKPAYRLQFSYKAGDEYKRLNVTGLFPPKISGAVGDGSISAERLAELAEFVTKAVRGDKTIYVTVWDNKDGGSRGTSGTSSGKFSAKKKSAAVDAGNDDDEDVDL
jgi:hypothetical protein